MTLLSGSKYMMHRRRIRPRRKRRIRDRFRADNQPWPLITTFLQSLPPNSLGLDSGAGNGKYLPVAASAGHVMIALDRSLGLLGIAKEQEGGMDIVRGDLGCRGWRGGVFVRSILFSPFLRIVVHLSRLKMR
jgi:hypothetical protein